MALTRSMGSSPVDRAFSRTWLAASRLTCIATGSRGAFPQRDESPRDIACFEEFLAEPPDQDSLIAVTQQGDRLGHQVVLGKGVKVHVADRILNLDDSLATIH